MSRKSHISFDFQQAPPCTDLWTGEENRIVNSPNLTLMTFSIKEGWEFTDKGHKSDQITIVLDGKIEMLVGKTKVVLTPGQGVYIPPFTKHSGRILSRKAKGIDIFFPIRTEAGYAEALKVG